MNGYSVRHLTPHFLRISHKTSRTTNIKFGVYLARYGLTYGGFVGFSNCDLKCVHVLNMYECLNGRMG